MKIYRDDENRKAALSQQVSESREVSELEERVSLLKEVINSEVRSASLQLPLSLKAMNSRHFLVHRPILRMNSFNYTRICSLPLLHRQMIHQEPSLATPASHKRKTR